MGVVTVPAGFTTFNPSVPVVEVKICLGVKGMRGQNSGQGEPLKVPVIIVID